EGIRDWSVTGVQTCALPIFRPAAGSTTAAAAPPTLTAVTQAPQVKNASRIQQVLQREYPMGLREAGVGGHVQMTFSIDDKGTVKIGRASCRERGQIWVGRGG